ncbi:MAG TPA: hypothetical protein VMG35_29590 [Bryobacteraceae bacterium]|nr:hypothetical protein [Bryobacteraceae bacterium]
MEARDLFARAKLLNLEQLRRDRPDWSDRLPVMHRRSTPATKDLVRWHWSYLVPVGFRERYDLWRMKRRHYRNLEQIEIDELNEVCEQAMIDDSPAKIGAIYEKHALRRLQSRFLVATKERPRLERLAERWDVDCPKLIDHGEANEQGITSVRRAIHNARWTFAERIARTLIPVLSLLVALVALLTR